MADVPLTPESNGFRMGLLTAVVLCAYTLLAVLLGFFSRIEAGALNVLILVAGVTLAIARYKKAKGNKMPYLQGFGTGIITAIVASVTLGLFFIVLSTILPKNTMDLTRARDLFGFDLSVIIAFLAIVLLGSMSGVVTSLIAMQAFKSPDHQPMSSIE